MEQVRVGRGFEGGSIWPTQTRTTNPQPRPQRVCKWPGPMPELWNQQHLSKNRHFTNIIHQKLMVPQSMKSCDHKKIISPIKIGTNLCVFYSEDRSWQHRTKTQANTDIVSFLLPLPWKFILTHFSQCGASWMWSSVHGVYLRLSRQGESYFSTKHNRLLSIFVRTICYKKNLLPGILLGFRVWKWVLPVQ